MRAMTEDEKELGAIIIRAQAKQYGDEETLATVAERAYRLGRETGQREAASLRHATLLAAEDALRAIADQINGVLRGGQ